jgi:hypothetical protein
LTNDEGEVRELTEEDFARLVPFSDLPPDLQKLLSGEKILKPDAEPKRKRQPAA